MRKGAKKKKMIDEHLGVKGGNKLALLDVSDGQTRGKNCLPSRLVRQSLDI